jgi:SAM-dependent methyltransferase
MNAAKRNANMNHHRSRREFMGLVGAGIAGVAGMPLQSIAQALAARDSDLVVLNAKVYFLVAPVEETNLLAASFDVITASQSWLYFDAERAISEVKRLLKSGGVLMTSHFGWLPREDPIAQAS